MNLRELKTRASWLCSVEGEAAPAAEAGGGDAPAEKSVGETFYPEKGAEAPVEAAPAEETPAPVEAEKPAEEAKPVEEAPAALEIKVPDGFEVDETAMSSFKEMATKAGLKNEDAQAIFDLYAGQASKLAEANVNAWNEMQNSWKSEIEADPELGGDKTPAVVQAIGRALDEFGSDGAREAFVMTGAGNNPEIVRFVYKMAQALSEGQITPGSRPAPKGPQTLGQLFYPDSETK